MPLNFSCSVHRGANQGNRYARRSVPRGRRRRRCRHIRYGAAKLAAHTVYITSKEARKKKEESSPFLASSALDTGEEACPLRRRRELTGFECAEKRTVRPYRRQILTTGSAEEPFH